MTPKVFFVGAGPGDPELLTLKAKRLIEQADVIVYADSLVNPKVCRFARKDAAVHGSASLTLSEIVKIMVDAVEKGKTVVRLHTGDPALYGAIREQMAALDQKGIDYEVVPGVSSLFAAAAALKAELTVPELSQTVIVTRIEGRTTVPESESLRALAAHRATMAVFLSVNLAERVSAELIAGGYPPSTPAVVVYRVGWPDLKVLRTTLDRLAGDVKSSGIKKQAIIFVGSFLATNNDSHRSRLYDKDFSHEYRGKV